MNSYITMINWKVFECFEISLCITVVISNNFSPHRTSYGRLWETNRTRDGKGIGNPPDSDWSRNPFCRSCNAGAVFEAAERKNTAWTKQQRQKDWSGKRGADTCVPLHCINGTQVSAVRQRRMLIKKKHYAGGFSAYDRKRKNEAFWKEAEQIQGDSRK